MRTGYGDGNAAAEPREGQEMRIDSKRVLLCDCGGSMPVDGRALGGDAVEPTVHRTLCRSQLDRFQDALKTGEPLLVGCTQEAPLFAEVASETDVELSFVNIRETAGWSEEGGAATAKMAALIAAAAVPVPPAKAVSMTSEGTCLVYGRDERTLAAAARLQGELAVTVVLFEPDNVIPPLSDDIPVAKGRLRRLSGHLGAFAAVFDGYAGWLPMSRGAMEFERPRDGVEERFDLVLDLTGGTPAVTGPDHRDGYVAVDPDKPGVIAEAILDMAGLIGTFEKPAYIAFDAEICAHSRAGRTGCTRCLDVCPAGAIEPAGDSIRLDAHLCAGCGNCAAVCPTGAATYDHPNPNGLLDRLRTLFGVYAERQGPPPRLLVHGNDSAATLAALARFGRGLPAACIPLELEVATSFGQEHLLAATAYGAAEIDILLAPKRADERAGFDQAVATTNAVLAGLGLEDDRIRILVTSDPDEVADHLWQPVRPVERPAADFLPLGGRRSLMRLALDHLHSVAPDAPATIPLPAGAPFGRTVIDADGCTLCMACVGACPTGALIDNPERPELRFLEDACVQCGLCEATCPEKVIALEPRVAFGDASRSPMTVKQEEPFDCVRCGKPFGTRSSIERIVQTLAAKHWMFQSGDQIERLKMCDDCRVVVQFEAGDNPMTLGELPRVRTTDDYKAEDQAKADKRADED